MQLDMGRKAVILLVSVCKFYCFCAQLNASRGGNQFKSKRGKFKLQDQPHSPMLRPQERGQDYKEVQGHRGSKTWALCRP